MSAPPLKTIVGVIAVAAAPLLTGMVLFGVLHGAARDAAIVLVTLAWQHAGTVIRSLFPGPEIDVIPPEKDKP